METIFIILIVLAVLGYYGFMRSVETFAKMGNSEVEHLEDVHMVALIERTARLDAKISEETIKSAEAVKAKLKTMRAASRS